MTQVGSHRGDGCLPRVKTETKAPFWRSLNSDAFPLPQTWSFPISLAACFPALPEEDNLRSSGLWDEGAQQTFTSGLVTAPAVRQCCNVGGRAPKARMRSPIPEACIPDLTLLCHLLAAEGLLFPSLSFCSDTAIPGLQQEPCAFKELGNVSRILSAGF